MPDLCMSCVQIRVQISQLQALQDNLSEERQNAAVLHKQKSTLKAMVENLTEEVSSWKSKASEAAHAEQGLKTQVAELHRQLELQREELAVAQATSRAATAVPSTPSVAASPARSADSASKAASEVSELRSTLAAAESSLAHKSLRCDELSAEVARLRAALTAKADELDQHRAQFTKTEAEIRAMLLEKERTIVVLQELISRLEVQSKTDGSTIEELRVLVLSEREQNKALNDVLNMIKDKDDATERMLSDLSQQRMAMTTRIVDMESKLITMAAELRESENRTALASRHLREAEEEKDALNKRYNDLRNKYSALEQSTGDRLLELETGKSRVHRQLMEEQEEIQRLRRKHEALEAAHESQSSDLHESRARASALHLKLDDALSRLQAALENSDSLKREVDSSRREIEALLIAADDRTVAGDASRQSLLAQVRYRAGHDLNYCALKKRFLCVCSCPRRMKLSAIVTSTSVFCSTSLKCGLMTSSNWRAIWMKSDEACLQARTSVQLCAVHSKRSRPK